MNKIILSLLALSSLAFAACRKESERPAGFNQFLNVYGGSGYEDLSDITATPDGSLAFGTIFQGGYDMYLVKTDPQGSVVWEKTFGGSKLDDGAYLVKDGADGYYLCGRSESYTDSLSVLVVKIDNAGNEIWRQTYQDDGKYTNLQRAIPTRDGGCLLLCYVFELDAKYYYEYATIIKIDAQGKQRWLSRYHNPIKNKSIYINTDGWIDITETPDGGLLLYTAGADLKDLEYDHTLVRMDNAGRVEWHKSFEAPRGEYPKRILPLHGGGYVLLGTTTSSGAGSSDINLLKLDASCNLLYAKPYGGGFDDVGYKIKELPGGGFIIVGRSRSYGNGDWTPFLLKTDAGGNELWHKTYPGGRDAALIGLDLADDGGYWASGYSGSFGNGKNDYDGIIIKTDSDGNIQ